MSQPVVADQCVDASGLECPMPVLLTKKAMARMQPGEILHVISTDPASEIDITAYACKFEHHLLHVIRANNCWQFYLEKAR